MNIKYLIFFINNIIPLPLQIKSKIFDLIFKKTNNKIWFCGENITSCEKFVLNYNNNNSKINSILDVGSYKGNSLKTYAQYFEIINQSINLYGVDISQERFFTLACNTRGVIWAAVIFFRCHAECWLQVRKPPICSQSTS